MNRETQIARLREFLERERGLEWSYLFGSVARGEPGRDVDVAVMPRAGEQFGALDLGRLVTRLSRNLGTSVDVVDLRAAPLAFAGALLEERVVVLDRATDLRRSWEVETTRRWLDFKPAFARFSALRREALRHRVGAGG